MKNLKIAAKLSRQIITEKMFSVALKSYIKLPKHMNIFRLT